MVVVVVVGLDFPGPPSARLLLRWTPLRRTAQNFALFSLPPPFHSFYVSLGVFSLNFGGVLKVGTPKCAQAVV